ncbi:MAG: tRNA adenosine(34) deaminase TadA [bacterium]
MKTKDHVVFMREALREAEKAFEKDEVPVGAVIVYRGKIIGRGHNRNITRNDPTAHAEIVAIKEASKHLKSARLSDTTIYVTIEPCAMCAGALVWARVKHLVYGARDEKSGACGSVINVTDNIGLNHRLKLTSGVMEQECREVIQSFFQRKRKKHKRK